MTKEELHKKYGFDYSDPKIMEIMKEKHIHPIYDKWLKLTWEIQAIYGHVHNEQISLGKARELVSAIIESTHQLTKATP